MATPPPEPRIRDVAAADLPSLLELYHQLSQGGEQPNELPEQPREHHQRALRELTASPWYRLLVAEADGQIVGTYEICILPGIAHGARPRAIVENVVVDERYRSRGVGDAMMRDAVERARAAGCFRVGLTSHLRRADAHRFYERLGFRHTHRGYTWYL